MKSLGTALTTAIAIIAFPSAASAEYLIPPGNSAVNQYTESVPTAGGHREVDEDGKGRRRSPAKVLGAGNARRLEEHGPSGREVAEVVAETAPSADVPTVSATGSDDTGETSAGGFVAGGGGGGTGDGDGGSGTGSSSQGADRAKADKKLPGTGAEMPDGSSPFGEVLGQATGSSSSGHMGLLLPLIVIGTIAWSLAFLWRRRDQPTA
jgi:hypothetical protein